MFNFINLPSFISILPFGFSIFDAIIICVIFFYAIEGYSLGFIGALLDLLSFVLAFLLAILIYRQFSSFLLLYVNLPQGFAKAIAFFIIALVSEIALVLLFRFIQSRLSFNKESFLAQRLQSTNHFLGFIPGIVSGIIVLSFLFSIILALPSSPYLKTIVADSKIGSNLVEHTVQIEKIMRSVFGDAVKETLTYLTIEPKSEETVNLRFTVRNAEVDIESEEKMFDMINKERERRGLKSLIMDESLRKLARVYANDMFMRGYFSHYNPEGKNPFNRMEESGIEFLSAGENLALAPSVELAMQGLMNSQGHRENILSSDFHKVGIGVMDGGIYGKMFVQEFTD